jgi:biopolymer transport protein ExbD
MRIRRRPEQDEELPMTPLIDVVFQLLLFFLTATSFYKIEKDIKVDPPLASEAQASPQRPQEITVNVRNESDGGFFVVDGRILELPKLEELLARAAKGNPTLVVIIRGDKQAYHQKIVDVLNACKKVNIKQYFIATTTEAAKP